MTNNTNKAPLMLLLGVPILLLVLSAFLGSNAKINDSRSLVNPYRNNMPEMYSRALKKIKVNDSTFFCTVIEDFVIRELVIFKAFPSSLDVKGNFTIELYPSDINHLKGFTDFLTYDLVNDATLFNYGDKAYGLFKIPLPIIDVEKLVVRQNQNNGKKEPWSTVIEKPFADLNEKDMLPLSDLGSQSKPLQTNPYTPLFIETLKNNDIRFLPSFYSNKNEVLHKAHEDIIRYCKSQNITIGKVSKQKAFWNTINSIDKNIDQQIEFEGVNNEKANQLLMDFINKKIKIEEVFNIDKLTFYNALKNVFVDDCTKEMFFIYNSNDNLLEPFYANSNCSWIPQKFVSKSDIKNTTYLSAYIDALDKVSEIDFYNEIIKDNFSLKQEIALINNYDAGTIFNYDVIKANQRAIKKSLNPSSSLKAELISIDSKQMLVSVDNLTNYPIEVLSLNHLEKKEITSLNPVKELLSGQKDTLVIDLPRSFENLFVSKKKKITGFVLPKHIYELSIQFRLLGLNKTSLAAITPYQKSKKVEDDLFRTASYINNHKSITTDDKKKEISFSKDSVVITSPLVIKKGYTFKLGPGTIVNIMEGGKIISHSPLNFIGTKDRPIKVYSSDKRGHGLLILSKQKQSTLKHVIFDQLRNPTHGNWGVTGAVTFYESPVDLQYVTVKNNMCEDALNIVRTTFTMDKVTIANTQSDAFDGDFVKGIIKNCQFDNLGNDAIDVSGSDLIIKNVVVSRAGDKGLSAGEDSKMTIDGVEISDSAIAVAGKDLSIVNAKNLRISNTKLGFTAFQKKPEFGPSQITVNGISMVDIETKYLIESSSSLFVDNEKIETTQNVKDRMYGVEFGRSSAETRNTPQ